MNRTEMKLAAERKKGWESIVSLQKKLTESEI